MPAAQLPAVRVNISGTKLHICDYPGRLASVKLEAYPQKHHTTHITGPSFIRETEHMRYNTTRGIGLKGSMSDSNPSCSTPETAGDVQTDSHAAEAGAGEEREKDLHEVKVVEGGSGANTETRAGTEGNDRL